MGGNALKVKGCRLSAESYNSVANRVVKELKELYPLQRVEAIKAYSNKPDFGDLDVLIESFNGYNPFDAAQWLDAVEVVRNGDVTSIGYVINSNVFQVDLIKIAGESYDFARCYFSYNDLGNLLGRVAHKMGFKLGHLGLMYVVREPNNDAHVLAEIPVTRDWSEALAFLGYDPARYEEGFQTLEHLFLYTVSSPYVSSAIYLLDNRNAKSRVRDSKRKTYMEFLDWLEVNGADGKYDNFVWTPEEKVKLRDEFLRRARTEFPTFSQAHVNVLYEWQKEERLRGLFNGEIVGRVTGLSGKELGTHMAMLRDKFTDKDSLLTWLYSVDPHTIDKFYQTGEL